MHPHNYLHLHLHLQTPSNQPGTASTYACHLSILSGLAVMTTLVMSARSYASIWSCSHDYFGDVSKELC